MDRGSLYTSSMMSSFSLPSLAEGSEYISEAEEINEVKSLMEKGNRAAKIKEFKSAIAHYNEALEIDDLNSAVLQARALALLQCGQFAEALVDAEKVIAINPGDYHGHLLLGVALQNQDQNKEALTSYLTALELDNEENTDKITNHIASVCSRFCDMPPELVKSLKDMDPYKKLSEVGVCLHQAKRYQLCIKVLEAAQKFQTNQKGITMRIFLTLANSYSSLRHTEQAISLYQECCSLAVATHDHLYQTKSLVNIASLYLESKDTHQAIVYYEKLLHLQAELLAEAGCMENMPEFWTKELQCGLHLNLSIAYKTIGNMYAAVKHARRYAELVEKYGIEGRPHAESYHNSGMLQEILGKYQEALEDYKKYLALSKKNKDQKGVGQAYGCLGSVYAALCNWPLSVSYHEQYLKTAIKLKDRRMMAFANEMLADTLALKGDHVAAISFYEAMLSCVRHDVKLKASALCKMGDSYRALGRNQYSLYFFEQASEIAEDYDFEDIQTLADFNIACIHQSSTQMQDMESARKAFQKLIPFFEMKIREHNEESSHCPDKYHEQLTKCYDGLQLVHSKSGNKEECLQLAEAHRKRNVTQLPNFSLLGPGNHSTGLHRDFWAMDRILRVVSEQSATVLYYSLFDSCLLLWVLEPGQGIARFYSKNAVGGDMRAQVDEMIQELRAGWDWEGREAEFDMRALPPKDLELQRIRDKNLKLRADGDAPPKPQSQRKPDTTKDKTAMDSEKEDTDKTTSAKKTTEDLIGTGDKTGKTSDDKEMGGMKTDSWRDAPDKTDSKKEEEENGEKGRKGHDREQEKSGEEKKDMEKMQMEKEATSTSRSISRLFMDQKQKPPSRKLFDLLLAPIEDILGEKSPNSHVVIIPDKELHRCPFHILRDWRGDTLGSRFQISYLPCLLLLERVVQNEQELLRIEDELEFERVQARKGGIYRLITQQGGQVSPRFTDASTISSVDKSSTVPELVFPPRVSNPRLLTSSLNVSNCSSARQKPVPMGITREDTFFTLGSTRKPQKELGSRQRQRTRTPESQINCASGEHGWLLNAGQGDTSPPPPMPASTNIPLKMLHRLGCPVPPEKMMSAHTFSTLTTRTSTGTDITQSEVSVVPFTQISNQDRCVVYGAPKLPHSLLLHGRPWHPGGEMLSAAREARKVAKVFDVTPVLGEFATKDQFLDDLQKASIIHITTFGCWREGYLVMAPNTGAMEEGTPQERSYLVTTADILALKLKAQLVVLSLGHSPYSHTDIPPGYTLPAAFLAAGALSVLVHAWPLPSTVLDKFYFHFYSALQSPNYLSLALQTAISSLQCDDMFSHVYSWGGFFLIGKDVSVSLQKVRHDMLHQLLDKVEQEAEERVPKPLLNPRQLVPSVRSKDEHLDSIQKYMRDVLHLHSSHPQITSGLIDLLDAALKRLHTEEINRQTSRLSESVAENRQAMELLKYLGFHFQPKGASPQSPYVVFPHWNREELLIPCYDALRAVTEIASNKECCLALCDVLPQSQDNISLVIDLLSITRHAPEVQLKVTDLSVRPLWTATKTRAMLAAAGFHQVGLLLNFNMEPQNKTLLTALLQFLLAMSCHKSQVLLYRLDVNLLGRPSASKASLRDSLEFHKLPSLTPLILPRNQLRMCTPWLSSVERTDEMREKMKLAKSKSQMEENFADYLERARSWHQTTLTAQANEELHRYGRPRTTPQRIMVIPGPTMSHPKTPLSQEARLNNPESDQRRDYAHYILQQRIDNINVHRKNEIIKMYQPYTKA